MRKLDDVGRKLEVLNDCLRKGSLSASTLMGLHQMANCVEVGDMGQAHSLYAHLSSGGSFSEISSFMPAIKVLLQLAQRFHG